MFLRIISYFENLFLEFLFRQNFIYQFNNSIINKKIVFIDIDNTIADTWPTLKNNSSENEVKRHLKLSVFPGMKNFINEKFRNSDFQIYFISARKSNLFKITLTWLKRNDCFRDNDRLILVSRPEKKLFYLKYVLKKKFDVIYIDDLSYNHENNEIKFYDDIIAIVKKLNIQYIGFYEIYKINYGI